MLICSCIGRYIIKTATKYVAFSRCALSTYSDGRQIRPQGLSCSLTTLAQIRSLHIPRQHRNPTNSWPFSVWYFINIKKFTTNNFVSLTLRLEASSLAFTRSSLVVVFYLFFSYSLISMAGPGGGPPRRRYDTLTALQYLRHIYWLLNSHTKSRKGCETCKRRHIRCDENFPQWSVLYLDFITF